MSTDQPPFWRGHRGRLLVGSLAGLVTAGIIIGLFLAWISTSALDAVGLDDATTDPQASPRTEPPDGTPSSEPDETESTTPTETTDPPTTTQDPQLPALTAAPTTVASFEPITLTGRFPGLPAGTPLQIERKQAGLWTLFPVQLSTSELGRFSTYVETGQPGTNLFRVTDPATGTSTPTVAVIVG